MSEISIKLGGKDFKAVLSIEALERIEAQFDNRGIQQVIQTNQGLRAGKAIVIACVASADSTCNEKEIGLACNKEVETNGLDSIWEIVVLLVKASGLFNRDKAKQALGN